jgi:hypothetical protein
MNSVERLAEMRVSGDEKPERDDQGTRADAVRRQAIARVDEGAGQARRF